MAVEEKCELCGNVAQIHRTTSPSGHLVKWCSNCKGQVHDLDQCDCAEAKEHREKA
ncbi:MAG: hypothetical protein ACFFBD_00315 [Candidatus Hodarchaeota archaeon]